MRTCHHAKDVGHICRVQMAENNLPKSMIEKYECYHEIDNTIIDTMPRVGILKMVLCSAASPRTEKYTSTPTPSPTQEKVLYIQYGVHILMI